MKVARLIKLTWQACLVVALLVAALPGAMAKPMNADAMMHHDGHQNASEPVAIGCDEAQDHGNDATVPDPGHPDPDCDYHCLAMGPALLPHAWYALPMRRRDGFGDHYTAPIAAYLGVDLRPPIV